MPPLPILNRVKTFRNFVLPLHKINKSYFAFIGKSIKMLSTILENFKLEVQQFF